MPIHLTGRRSYCHLFHCVGRQCVSSLFQDCFRILFAWCHSGYRSCVSLWVLSIYFQILLFVQVDLDVRGPCLVSWCRLSCTEGWTADTVHSSVYSAEKHVRILLAMETFKSLHSRHK